jgi:hypothetical protein
MLQRKLDFIRARESVFKRMMVTEYIGIWSKKDLKFAERIRQEFYHPSTPLINILDHFRKIYLKIYG